ncbi:MAG: hypothetical protein DSY81_01915 [Bacillota bacterium]|nr:MAG: hypothetical protein DSY92_09000 [Planctomycetota bacterium]RUA11006.1 MAG: hypothetical protein DSY81_01915 [Bacillota bacterium]
MTRAVSAQMVTRCRWLALPLLALLGLVVLQPGQVPVEALLQRDTTIEDRSHLAAKAESALLISVVREGEVVLVAGDHGLILRSTDGGKSFRQIVTPTRRMLTSIVLGENGIAFAAGHDTTVLRSLDRGLTWQSVHCDPEANLALFTIQSIDGKRIVAAGSFGTVMISDDGGDNWRQQLISEDGPHIFSLQNTTSRLIATGEFGSIFESTNGGDTWQLLESPYDGSFFHIMALEPSTLLVMGLRGNLWEGEPGNWKRIETSSEASLFGGCRLSDSGIVVVGDEGLALRRSPEGRWQDISPGERRILSSVVELPGGELLIVGEKGFVRPQPRDDGAEGSSQEGRR